MIIFFITFTLFFIEALIHYNYGRKGEDFYFPDFDTCSKLIITLAFFSFLNSAIIKYLYKYYKIRH